MKPAPTTPPSAARNAPSAKTPADTSGTLIPTPCAISASSTVARMLAPARVLSRKTHNTIPTAKATAMMKSR